MECLNGPTFSHVSRFFSGPPKVFGQWEAVLGPTHLGFHLCVTSHLIAPLVIAALPLAWIVLHKLEIRLYHLYTLDLRPRQRKFTIENAEEVSKWLERESSGEVEENQCETPSTSTGTGRTEVMDTGTPESAKGNGSPNVRMGQKRTINSPVTIKKCCQWRS